MEEWMLLGGWLGLVPLCWLISQCLCRLWRRKQRSRFELIGYGIFFVLMGLLLMFFLSKGVLTGDVTAFCRSCRGAQTQALQPISFWSTVALNYVITALLLGTGVAGLRMGFSGQTPRQ